MVMDFSFYDEYPKKDDFNFRMYNYIGDYVKAGGLVYSVQNPVEISEIDYIEDLSRLYDSVDKIIEDMNPQIPELRL